MSPAIPKPPKAEPRARQRNSTLPVPSKPLRSKGRIKPKARKASEFQRIYGSRARVAWIKKLPCLYCVAVNFNFALVEGRSENAHTVTGGMGRKADYDTIIPLCHSHHTKYDQHQPPFDNEALRDDLKRLAARVEQEWQSYTAKMSLE